MSCIYFLASDTELKEMRNPYVSYANGRVWLSNSLASLYPTIFRVEKKECEQLPISRKFVLGLDFRWNEKSVELLIQYMQGHLLKASEIELLSIWLGGNRNLLSKKILLKQLSYDYLDKFLDDETYEDNYDMKKLTILNRFY